MNIGPDARGQTQIRQNTTNNKPRDTDMQQPIVCSAANKQNQTQQLITSLTRPRRAMKSTGCNTRVLAAFAGLQGAHKQLDLCAQHARASAFCELKIGLELSALQANQFRSRPEQKWRRIRVSQSARSVLAGGRIYAAALAAAVGRSGSGARMSARPAMCTRSKSQMRGLAPSRRPRGSHLHNL
eukprot:4163633-Pleurochrysis_carterae.AAC.1